MNIKRYSELKEFTSFEDRFKYLLQKGRVGEETFGYQRWYNQKFYQTSVEWKKIRDLIIIRDNGCDLGIDGLDIHGAIYIHHINPISYDDLINQRPCLFDPENLICTTHATHNAIHYGDESFLFGLPIERKLNDTCPWKKNC